MAVNIFEGSRRIAMLAAGLATVGTAIVVITDDPYVSVGYSISHPRDQFKQMDGSCPIEAGKHYFTVQTHGGKRVSIDLCLLTMPFGDKGRQLIPYRVDDKGLMWGAETYSSEVSGYETQLEQRFVLTPAEDEKAEKEIARRHRKNMAEGLGYLAIGLAIFGCIVWIVGWIVRGFLGIPQGMDRRSP